MTNEETDNREIVGNPKIDAIWNSGFLLERRVASLLHKLGYKAITNRGFYDNESNKSLEYDVYAYKSFNVFDNSESCQIYPTLIVECKNNKEPIAFFNQDEREFEPLIDEVRISGIPSKIWKRNNYISLQEFVNISSFHHYCKPKAPVATMCCKFIETKYIKPSKKDPKPKQQYKADHDTELNDIYKKLTKAMESEIEDDFKIMSQWLQPSELGEEFIDLSIYYPIVIYQGGIDSIRMNNIDNPQKEDIIIENRDHIQFNPEYYSYYDKEVISYHIDIITEKYLENYVKMIEKEVTSIKEAIKQEKRIVRRSIDKIIGECQGLDKQPDELRKHMEYKF